MRGGAEAQKEASFYRRKVSPAAVLPEMMADGSKKKVGGGVFLRASHSPPGLRSFLIRRVVDAQEKGG